MALFRFEYQDEDGADRTTGDDGAHLDIDAQDITSATLELEALGFTVIDGREITRRRFMLFLTNLLFLNLRFRFGASLNEYSMLCEIIAAMYSAGIGVLDVVRLTAGESDNPWLGKKMLRVADDIEDGASFSEALQGQKKVFPVEMIYAVRAGEETGNVGHSLSKVAELFKRKADVRRDLISAMIYPGITLTVFIGVCIALVIMIPSLLVDAFGKDQMAEMEKTFPLAIKILFNLKRQPLYVLGPVAGGTLFWFIVWLGKKKTATRLLIARIARRIPLIGKLRFEFALVDLLESLALNQESGVLLDQSLDLIKNTTRDDLIADALERVKERVVHEGDGFADSLRDESVFPGLVCQVVSAAENTGQLSEMLYPVASYYQLKAKATLKRMIDAVTPVMIIMLASVIAPVIFGLNTVVQKALEAIGNT